ncbi:MAG: alpha/beta hydrolase, partial [Halomonadaceae bacterium]
MRASLLALATAGALLISAPVWSLNLIGGGSGNPFSKYASTGPHTTVSEAAGSECTVYRPANLTSGHPVILWGNGTGTGPGTYQGGLNHWASWGYVVVAANTQNAGSGEEMLGCLDYLTDNTMASQLNLNRVGTSGHSQGGGGSLMSGRDSRITATAPMQPYIQGLGHDQSSLDQQAGTMLLL